MRPLARLVLVALLALCSPALAAPPSLPTQRDPNDPDEARYWTKDFPVYVIPTPTGDGVAPVSVVGEVQTYRIRKGDTLMDLARWFSLGYNEIVDANPGIDPWVPPAGSTVILPTQWVLPCCDYKGVIINIPEMRLFYFRTSPDNPALTLVQTYPVGLGRDEWRTPRGKFKITGKTVNPQWNIPESIRQEHIQERGDHRTFIAGGAPDNPLGSRRLELTIPAYRIHGTNIPWGVGMQVSHGCVRLYPEDIEHVFPAIPVGTPGEFAYQSVKIGTRDGHVWAETQSDIYGYEPTPYRETRQRVYELGLASAIEESRLVEGMTSSRGLPFQISPGERGAELVSFDLMDDEGAPTSN